MYGHYAHELRKVSIELPRFAVLASVHRTATVSSFDPRKKVRIELQTVAVLWTLFKTAIYGCCAQVYCMVMESRMWSVIVCMILCGLIWFSIVYAYVFLCKVSNDLVWLRFVLVQ